MKVNANISNTERIIRLQARRKKQEGYSNQEVLKAYDERIKELKRKSNKK